MYSYCLRSLIISALTWKLRHEQSLYSHTKPIEIPHKFSIKKDREAPQQSETRSTLLIRQKRALLPFKFIYKKTLGQVVNTYKVGAREARASL